MVTRCFYRQCSFLVPVADLESLLASNGLALCAIIFDTRSDGLHRLKRLVLVHLPLPYAQQ